MLVSSSAIKEVHYMRKTKTLYVLWRPTKTNPEGRTSVHFDVPVEIWNEFKESDSRGSYFWNNIRGNYQWQYLSTPEKG